MTAPDRRRTAYHEAAHATASVHLFGDGSVDILSLRHGQSYHGATLLTDAAAPRSDEPLIVRDWRERKIIVTLAGDLAAMFAVPTSGYIEDSPDELTAVQATEALARLPMAGVTRLLASEAAEDSEGDEATAYGLALSLGDYDLRAAGLYLALLRVRTEVFVVRHVHAIRAVAEAALECVVIPGPDIAAIVRSSRCACHGWTPLDATHRQSV